MLDFDKYECYNLPRSPLFSILSTRTLDKMIKALKIQRVNGEKLGLKSKTNYTILTNFFQLIASLIYFTKTVTSKSYFYFI